MQLLLHLRFTLTSIIIALFIAACGGSGADSGVNAEPQQQEDDSGTLSPDVDGVPADVLENLDRTGTLLGIDDDSDGVRDDIGAYINQRFSDAEQRSAARQFARSMSLMLAVPENDQAAAIEADRQNALSEDCVFEKFLNREGSISPYIVIDEIESLTTNTKMRLTTYLARDKLLSGTISSLPDGETCD